MNLIALPWKKENLYRKSLYRRYLYSRPDYVVASILMKADCYHRARIFVWEANTNERYEKDLVFLIEDSAKEIKRQIDLELINSGYRLLDKKLQAFI